MHATEVAVSQLCRTLLGQTPAPRRTLEEYLASIPRLDSLADVPPGSPVLVRGDLDCKPGPNVGDGDIRLRSMLDTLRYGRERGWKQVVFGHVGRKREGSLNAVSRRLEQLLGCPIVFVADWFDETTTSIRDEAEQAVARATPGSIILLENTRKYAIERTLWDATPADVAARSTALARLANQMGERIARVYVNEALSAGSLDASTTIVPMAMERVALGKYVASEFDGPMRRCLRAEIVVFSGLKTDKLDDLEAMIARGTIRTVITAGSLAMALKKADAQLSGGDFGLGLAENPAHAEKPYFIAPERVEQARRMLAEGRRLGIEFVLPVDFVLQDGRTSATIGADDQQFDVGPKTCEHFAAAVDQAIAKAKARSGEPMAVFYNGVFGMFEDPRFESGTRHFIGQLKRLTDAGIEVYVGGGEGGAALEKYGQSDWIKHCFTAGGTVLNALGSAPVPFLLSLSVAARWPQ